MMDALRDYYQEYSKELQLIDHFERNYPSNDPIQWYLNHSFLRKILNKALLTKDIDQLYMFRYFLVGLIKCLIDQHEQIIRSGGENFMIHQLNKLTKKELKYLQDNSSSFHSNSPSNLIDVLFEIECNARELDNSFISADPTRSEANACQKQVLFNFNTTFKLENIQQKQQIWIIKSTVIIDRQMITQKYINDARRQIEDLSIPMIFEKLMIDMNKWNQAQRYFQYLLNRPYDEDLAWIEHALGQTHQWQGNLDEARKYYDSAYDRMINTKPIRIKDIGVVLFDIGEVLYIQEKCEEGNDFYQRALIIQKKYYSSNHPRIAASLESIGRIHQMKPSPNEALVPYKQALIL